LHTAAVARVTYQRRRENCQS